MSRHGTGDAHANPLFQRSNMFAARRPTVLLASFSKASTATTTRSLSTALLRPSVGFSSRSQSLASTASSQKTHGLRFISETFVRKDGGHGEPPDDGIHPDQPTRMDLSVSFSFTLRFCVVSFEGCAGGEVRGRAYHERTAEAGAGDDWIGGARSDESGIREVFHSRASIEQGTRDGNRNRLGIGVEGPVSIAVLLVCCVSA